MTVNQETRENLHLLLDAVIDAIDNGEPTVLFMLNGKVAHIHARKEKKFSDSKGWDVTMTFKEEITGEDVKAALDALEKTKKGVCA